LKFIHIFSKKEEHSLKTYITGKSLLSTEEDILELDIFF